MSDGAVTPAVGVYGIILCERGGVADVVKVLDFGLVKDVEAPKDAKLSATDTVQGTPPKPSPTSLGQVHVSTHRQPHDVALSEHGFYL